MSFRHKFFPIICPITPAIKEGISQASPKEYNGKADRISIFVRYVEIISKIPTARAVYPANLTHQTLSLFEKKLKTTDKNMAA